MHLEQYREENKFTYDKLAEVLELSKNMVWRLCQGKARCIKLSDAHKIVKGTSGRVSFESLLEDLGDC